MARVIWKDGHVISVETRTGLYALAQMSREPYLLFFNAFSNDDRWDGVDLASTPILFCQAVTRQFLIHSNVAKRPEIKPLVVTELPTRWIHSTIKFKPRKASIWQGTTHERTLLTHDGAALVEKDVLRHKGGPYAHPSGVFDRIVIESIDPKDDATIDAHELTSLGVFAATNERLYLCHTFGRNVDPEKDLLFDRDMPIDYDVYFDVTQNAEAHRKRLEPLYAFAMK
jgi:hypothetical protein